MTPEKLEEFFTARIRELEVEVAGLNKANALLNAGMGAVCEGRDELKHRNRELEAKVVKLQGIVNGLAERVHRQSDLLSRRAERPSSPNGD
jgi:peptidoglycan hydrolase CwlO-like protein